MKMGWEDAPPYQFKEGNIVKGSDVEIFDLIMNELKCPSTKEEIPWNRHLKELEMGRVEVAGGSSVSDERKKFAYFSKSYAEEALFLLILQSDSSKYKFKNVEEVAKSGIILGGKAGSFLGDDFEQLIKDGVIVKGKNFLEGQDDNQVDELLLTGRIKGILLAEIPLKVNPKIKVYPVKLNEHTTHFMFSKKSVPEDFIKEFDVKLTELKNKGLIKKILKQYNDKK